ncbi:hypothetical protein HK105_200501 [Polyrhizophydium stewartii]|uniref:Armadillo repeat-containing protein 8 n=1 Tax=Polyrhizophydium stewartii TaxID=2732419 RepID=A0ABR4NJD4_9FUNG
MDRPRLQQQNSSCLTGAHAEALLRELSSHHDPTTQQHAAAQVLGNTHARAGTLIVSLDFDMPKSAIVQASAVLRLTLNPEVLEATILLLGAIARGQSPECRQRAALMVASGIFDKVADVAAPAQTAHAAGPRATLIHAAMACVLEVMRASGETASLRFCGGASVSTGSATSAPVGPISGGSGGQGLAAATAMISNFPASTPILCCVLAAECVRLAASNSGRRAALLSANVLEVVVGLLRRMATDDFKATANITADSAEDGVQGMIASLFGSLCSITKNLLAHSHAAERDILDDDFLECVRWMLRRRRQAHERVQILEVLANCACNPPDEPLENAESVIKELLRILESRAKQEERPASADKSTASSEEILLVHVLRCIHNMTLNFGEPVTLRVAEHIRTLFRYVTAIDIEALAAAQPGDVAGAAERMQLPIVGTQEKQTGSACKVAMAVLAMGTLRSLALLDKPPSVRADMSCFVGDLVAILRHATPLRQPTVSPKARPGDATATNAALVSALAQNASIESRLQALIIAPETAKSGVNASASTIQRNSQTSRPLADQLRELQAMALDTICNLSIADKAAQMVATLGGAALFSALYSLVMFSPDTALQRLALASIRNLCIDEESCTLILTMGGGKLLELLYHDAAGVRVECMQVVRNLVMQHEASFQEMYGSDGFVSEVVASLCSSSVATQACAIDMVKFCLDQTERLPCLGVDLVESGCLPALLVPAEACSENSRAAAECFERLHALDRSLNGSGDPFTRLWREWKEQDRSWLDVGQGGRQEKRLWDSVV